MCYEKFIYLILEIDIVSTVDSHCNPLFSSTEAVLSEFPASLTVSTYVVRTRCLVQSKPLDQVLSST